MTMQIYEIPPIFRNIEGDRYIMSFRLCTAKIENSGVFRNTPERKDV